MLLGSSSARRSRVPAARLQLCSHAVVAALGQRLQVRVVVAERAQWAEPVAVVDDSRRLVAARVVALARRVIAQVATPRPAPACVIAALLR